ncbi:hypothetical protein KC345_g243 [Hortaea werneckii]|nr:hypothetical protein KC345_g243 [Hortaea werneckii]
MYAWSPGWNHWFRFSVPVRKVEVSRRPAPPFRVDMIETYLSRLLMHRQSKSQLRNHLDAGLMGDKSIVERARRQKGDDLPGGNLSPWVAPGPLSNKLAPQQGTFSPGTGLADRCWANLRANA